MRAYGAHVSIRRLFVILIAFAVLFAPAMTSTAMATAAPANQMLMMDHSGHCQMPFGGSADHHKSDSKSCCISMCMAVAVQPASAALVETLPQSPAEFPAATFHLGYLAEIATPPPRNA